MHLFDALSMTELHTMFIDRFWAVIQSSMSIILPFVEKMTPKHTLGFIGPS